MSAVEPERIAQCGEFLTNAGITLQLGEAVVPERDPPVRNWRELDIERGHAQAGDMKAGAQ